MQISRNLPQFEDGKTLIIISGIHECRYLVAEKGNIEEVHEFKKEKITYSDREGHFLKRAFGRVFGSGSVYEPNKQREMIEFVTEFEKNTLKVLNDNNPEKIILMVPEYASNQIIEKLPTNAKGKIRLRVHGNYFKMKDGEILKKIQNEIESEEKTEVMSEEAKKILEKGNN